jgi:glycosyltransferase involved in cell wall biosynthesis
MVSCRDECRIAWLILSLRRGNYWQPVLSEFTKIFKETIVYTGGWDGFVSGLEGKIAVEVVGKTQFIEAKTNQTLGYNHGFSYVSPRIVNHLLQFKPHVIFVNAFSLWTLLVLLFKPLGRWRVVIAYEGSSPTVDYRDSQLRLMLRRLMVKGADALITNNGRGKTYLTEILKAEESRVFARPYEVADAKALLGGQADIATESDRELRSPIFLFMGQVIPRKGIQFLLEACARLGQQAVHPYTLLIVGDGEQREELEVFIQNQGLAERVKWEGWVSYHRLGSYFRKADVFVLPTLEDTWGMVVLEAMTFGKPILCSKWAGASELVVEGENGYLFDPYNPEELAELMRRFLNDPELIVSMGQKSQQLIAQYTPESAAKFLAELTSFALDGCSQGTTGSNAS